MKLLKSAFSLALALFVATTALAAPGDITGLKQKNAGNAAQDITITGVVAGEILKTNSANRVQSLNIGWVDVRDHGAIGDDTNDDTAEIQAALTAAAAAGLATYIPETTTQYKISDDLVLVDNQVVFGNGFRSKIKQVTNAKNVMSATGKTGIVIRGVHLAAKGDWAATVPTVYNALMLSNCTHCRVEDCTFTEYAFGGVMLYRSSYCEVLKNNFPNPGTVTDPLTLQGQVNDIFCYSSGSYNVVAYNKCVSTGANPGQGGIHFVNLDGLTMVGNRIEYNTVKGKNQYGIVIYNADSVTVERITDNEVTGNLVEDIDGSYIRPTMEGSPGSTFFHEGGVGIYSQSAQRSKITGNTVRRTGLYARRLSVNIQDGGIAVSGSSDSVIQNNTVEYAYTHGIGASNVLAATNGSDGAGVFVVRGNKVAHCGRYYASGSITSGTDDLVLATAGGFWVGDAIRVNGAGAAGAALDTTITAIAGTALTLAANASTTVAAAQVYLSESGNAWVPNNAGIFINRIHNAMISANNVSKCYDHGIYATGGAPFGNLLNTHITANYITNKNPITAFAGNRYGIRLAFAEDALIDGNTVATSAITAILADATLVRVSVQANKIYSAGTGIKILATGGFVDGNFIYATTTGINSQNTEVLGWNEMVSAVTPYSNNAPLFDFISTGLNITGVLTVSGGIAGDGANVTNVAASNISGTYGDITMTGALTREGSQTLTPNPITTVIDVTKGNNTVTATGNITFTFSATPPDGTSFGVEITPDVVDRTHQIPSCTAYLIGPVTQVLQKANQPLELIFKRKVGSYIVFGVPLYTTDLPTATPDTAADYFAFSDTSTGLESKALLSTIAGTGTVTASGGALTANAVVLGAGTTDTKVVAGITTNGTSALNLGVAGASVGSIVYSNATSGTITVSPPAGALGTVAVTLPGAAGTLAILGANTFTGAQTNSTAGAASVPASYLTGAFLTGGSGTTNFPHLFLQPSGATAATTWSTAGTILGGNAATGFVGNFIDMKLAGAATSGFKVDYGGNVACAQMECPVIGASRTAAYGQYGVSLGNTMGVSFYTSAGATGANNGTLKLESSNAYQWGEDAAAPAAQVLKGADARAGTDTNTAGNSLTIASGRGTGTAATTATVVNIQTPTAVGSGTGAQTLTTRLSVGTAGTVFGVGGTAVTTIISAAAAIDFASMLTATEDTKTITVTGVATTNTPSVALGWSASLEAGITVQQAWVSGANTVTIRVRNNTVGTIDPASLTVRATVTSF